MSEWVSSFLTALQHRYGHSVPSTVCTIEIIGNKNEQLIQIRNGVKDKIRSRLRSYYKKITKGWGRSDP